MQTSLKAHVSFRTPGSGPAVLCNTIENLAIRGSYADLVDQLRTLLAAKLCAADFALTKQPDTPTAAREARES